MTDRNTIIRECIAALPPRIRGGVDDIAIMYDDTVEDCHAALDALLSVPDQAANSEGETGIVWGAPIEVGEDIPDWLVPGFMPMQYQTGDRARWFDMKWGWGWSCVGGMIRLPADHPYYQKADQPIKLDWKKPIEVVDSVGYVEPAEFLCRNNGDVMAIKVGERHLTALPNGYVDQYRSVRNVGAADDWTPDKRTIQLCIDKVGAINSHGVSSAAKAALQSLLPPDPIAALVEELLHGNETLSQEYYDGMTDAIRRLVSEGRLTL